MRVDGEKLGLELGGNAPMIVLKSADLCGNLPSELGYREPPRHRTDAGSMAWASNLIPRRCDADVRSTGDG